MRVDVYSTMRNEIRMIPYFLRHYETFADRIFVWDDGSDDGTREILEAHPKVKLLPINLGRIDDVYFVRRMWPQYENISRGYADWVICVDADEFVYHPNIMEKFEELHSKGVKKICCDGFTMYHPVFPETAGQIYDVVKLGVKDKWSTKTILFNPDIRIRWSPGRHYCYGTNGVETVYGTGINLLHFRYLGWEYFRERITKVLACANQEFTMEGRYNLPDGTMGKPYEWYESQKNKFIRMI